MSNESYEPCIFPIQLNLIWNLIEVNKSTLCCWVRPSVGKKIVNDKPYARDLNILQCTG